jgi:hypothetical protein
MLRLALLAIFAALLLSPLAAGPAFAQSDALPTVGADGMIQPLTVDQLDSSELATFAALTPDSDDARQFLYTRGYLRYCRLVVAETLPPLQLPPLPARSNWNRQFLSQDERESILDVALAMKMTARLNQSTP